MCVDLRKTANLGMWYVTDPYEMTEFYFLIRSTNSIARNLFFNKIFHNFKYFIARYVCFMTFLYIFFKWATYLFSTTKAFLPLFLFFFVVRTLIIPSALSWWSADDEAWWIVGSSTHKATDASKIPWPASFRFFIIFII